MDSEQALQSGELTFPLSDRPWIPVLRLDGGESELSLREVFARAGELRRLVGDLPTQEFALLRLLLAVAHDALDGPGDLDDWEALWGDEDCFAPVDAYLSRHSDRFDLLHPSTPFFQTADLRTARNEVFSLNRIVADVPNGEPFFSARQPSVERLGFAEAARWLVHAHAYDTSGIKTGVVGDDRAKGGKVYPLGVGWAGNLGGVFVEGTTLRETLLLNLIAAESVRHRQAEDDRPAWRRARSGPGARKDTQPTGLRDLYTWQTRRLRLHFEREGVHGVVLGYGDPLPPRDLQNLEPMTPWRRSRPQEKKLGRSPVYLPLEHEPGRDVWRGLDALISARPAPSQGGEPAERLRPGVLEWVARLAAEGLLPRGFLIRTRTVGAAYGTQQSVFDEITDDRLAMTVVLLHRQDRDYAQQAIDAVKDAEGAVNALGDLATNLARSAGTNPEGARIAARERGFAALDGPYRIWLAGLPTAIDPDEARSEWRRETHVLISALAARLLAEAGDGAWRGRTVEMKQGPVWLNSATADEWFRISLGRALGWPHSAAAGGATVRASSASEADPSHPTPERSFS